MELADLRLLIDGVDDQILDLLARRAELAAQVGEIKRREGGRFHDPEREQRVLGRLAGRGAGRFPAGAVSAVFREVMSGCLSLEAPLQVAFLGPEGTFSHMAARRLFGMAALYREAGTIYGVVDAVRRGDCELGVVPIENSAEGTVGVTVDALIDSGLLIRRELVLPVCHCLLSRAGGLTQVARVYSHPQALSQCRLWLAKNLPQAQLVHTASTSAAVREALLDEGGAAVASRLAGELHDVPVLRERIQDQDENATRFLVLGERDAPRTGDDKTTLAFTVVDERGALRRALALFEEAGVNLCRIESRPSRRRPFDYVFLVDLLGHREDEPIAAAIAALTRHSEGVRLLGSYPRSQPTL